MNQKGFIHIFLLTTIFIAIAAIIAYSMSTNKKDKTLAGITPDETIYAEESPVATHSPTLSPTPTINFSFTTPTGWAMYEDEEYKDLDIEARYLRGGKVAISDNDEECVFYAGRDNIGREGPSNILDNTEVAIDGTQFTVRSWYQEDGGLPFFRYYFPSDHTVTIYSWITDQDCVTDINSIVESFRFD